MRDWITITATQPLDTLQDKLESYLGPRLREQGITLDVQVQQIDDSNIILHCCFSGAANGSMPHRRQLAELLSDVILENWQPSLLHKVVKKIYGDLDPSEQDDICRHASIQLKGRFRRGYVLRRLREYLDHHDFINLNGFIAFRLPDYLDDLEEAVDRAVDEILIEREYREFMRFLQYLVETQSPKADRVHVLLGSNAAFRLLDESGQSLHLDNFVELLHVNPPPNLDMDDILISALIGISPRLVILHDPRARCSWETADALQTVFQQRLLLCTGCRLCEYRHRME